MKKRLIAAALAALFMLPIFGLTAYATELDGLEDMPPEEIIITDGTATPNGTTDDIINGDASDEATGITETPVTDYPETPPRPFTPAGTGTVIDHATDEDGKEFYTIMTPDEHVFYLVIDKQRSAENVYFLNAVTIADLAALAELPAQTQGGMGTTPPPTESEPEPQTETPPPDEQPQSGGNMGMYIIIGLIVIGGGGAGWYFKIYRPKQQGMASGEEYDPSMNEAENDYTADWDEDEQDEAGDGLPPWDEDGESVDDE